MFGPSCARWLVCIRENSRVSTYWLIRMLLFFPQWAIKRFRYETQFQACISMLSALNADKMRKGFFRMPITVAGEKGEEKKREEEK